MKLDCMEFIVTAILEKETFFPIVFGLFVERREQKRTHLAKTRVGTTTRIPSETGVRCTRPSTPIGFNVVIDVGLDQRKIRHEENF